MANPHSENNKILLLKVSGGDEMAFRQIFDQYRDQVYTFSLFLTRSEFLSEEITQEVFMKIWTYRKNLTTVEYFSAYIKTIAKNILNDHLKKIAREKLALSNVAKTTSLFSDSVENGVDAREIHQILQKAVVSLPPQQKKIYLLSRNESLSYEEIADELHISVFTVKEHMKKALFSIRKNVGQRINLSGIAALIMLLLK